MVALIYEFDQTSCDQWLHSTGAILSYVPWVLCFPHLNSMERLDHLAEKFKHKCNIHEAWTSGKVDTLKTDDQEKATLADVLVDNQS